MVCHVVARTAHDDGILEGDNMDDTGRIEALVMKGLN